MQDANDRGISVALRGEVVKIKSNLGAVSTRFLGAKKGTTANLVRFKIEKTDRSSVEFGMEIMSSSTFRFPHFRHQVQRRVSCSRARAKKYDLISKLTSSLMSSDQQCAAGSWVRTFNSVVQLLTIVRGKNV